jgi:hypothetical protein
MDGVNVNAHYETGILLLGMLATGLNGSYWENVCQEVVIRIRRQVNEHGPVLTQGAARRGLLRQRAIVPCLTETEQRVLSKTIRRFRSELVAGGFLPDPSTGEDGDRGV